MNKKQARRSSKRAGRYSAYATRHNAGLTAKGRRVFSAIANHNPSTKNITTTDFNTDGTFTVRTIRTRASGDPQPGWKLSLNLANAAVPVSSHGKRSKASEPTSK